VQSRLALLPSIEAADSKLTVFAGESKGVRHEKWGAWRHYFSRYTATTNNASATTSSTSSSSSAFFSTANNSVMNASSNVISPPQGKDSKEELPTQQNC
jgi:hypothetical protein